MSSSQPAAPSPAPVIQLIEAFRRSQAMFTATELGIFDLLHGGPRPLAQLAEQTQTNPEALARLLALCINLGLLSKQESTYANTDLSQQYLAAQSPASVAGYVIYSRRALWHLWSNLPDAIREGTNRWEQTFGGQGELFSHYYKTEADKRRFLLGMHAFGLISSPQITTAADLSPFTHLVDLGGATGHLAKAAVERFPHLRATLFDLPECIPLAQEMLAGSQVETVGGDFFRDELPAADLFALGRILHDWTEAKIAVLLKKIHAALPAGGGILICEKLIDTSGVGPTWALLQDLNMLVATEGRERTFEEYRQLLEAAGFHSITAYVLPESPLDAVLARK
jgi:acetylserotonin N-methyltransferase